MKLKNHFVKRMVSFCVLSAMLTVAAGAGNIAGSPLGTGLKQMVSDVSLYLLVLCPIVGGVAAVYFLIRRGMADDQDGKMWMHRIVVAVTCGVAGALVGGIITLISSYF